jgi:hypothetical protein
MIRCHTASHLIFLRNDRACTLHAKTHQLTMVLSSSLRIPTPARLRIIGHLLHLLDIRMDKPLRQVQRFYSQPSIFHRPTILAVATVDFSDMLVRSAYTCMQISLLVKRDEGLRYLRCSFTIIVHLVNRFPVQLMYVTYALISLRSKSRVSCARGTSAVEVPVAELL